MTCAVCLCVCMCEYECEVCECEWSVCVCVSVLLRLIASSRGRVLQKTAIARCVSYQFTRTSASITSNTRGRSSVRAMGNAFALSFPPAGGGGGATPWGNCILCKRAEYSHAESSNDVD